MIVHAVGKDHVTVLVKEIGKTPVSGNLKRLMPVYCLSRRILSSKLMWKPVPENHNVLLGRKLINNGHLYQKLIPVTRINFA